MVNNEKALLQEAIDALTINDVFVQSASLNSPATNGIDLLSAGVYHQGRHSVQETQLLKGEFDGQQVQMFRVLVSLGVRWIKFLDEDGEEQQNADPSDDRQFESLGEVGAIFVAEYRLSEDVSTEALDTFARINASFHVWPYWREFVTAACNRMNIPRVMVPATQFAQNRDAEFEEVVDSE